MMPVILSRSMGIAGSLIFDLARNGPILSIDRWALDHGWTPWKVNRHVHELNARGVVQLRRHIGKPGRPYEVIINPKMLTISEENP